MNDGYIKLGLFALVPVALSVAMYLAEKKTPFGKLPYIVRQIIIGILFGGVAVLATEFGIPVNGAVLNVRDSAPLCAGLLFGMPAGIVSGVIGGVERWFAALWGGGEFTRLACSLATVFAGLFAAFMRKVVFDDRNPYPGLGFASGVVAEVFHLSMVYITNFDQTEKAAAVIKSCTLPLILANAASVFLACLMIILISRESMFQKKNIPGISKRIQRGLFICVTAGYLFTTAFLYFLQTGVAKSTAEGLLKRGLEDVNIETDILNRADSERSHENCLKEAAENRHIGETGYILVADYAGVVISSPENYRPFTLRDAGIDTKHTRIYEMYQGKAGGEDAFILYDYDGEDYLIGVYPFSEAMETRNNFLYVNSFMEVMVFAAMFIVISLVIKKHITKRIYKVNQDLGKITEGNLDTVLNVNSSREFAELSSGINATVDTLKKYIREANERIDAELKLAKEIQISALPENEYSDEKAELYAVMTPAKEVGGDFYDFYRTDDGMLNFCVADVSGKGIPAAMFMMRSKTQLRNMREAGKELPEVLEKGNSQLCEGNDSEMFVTCWMGSLNENDGTVRFANAGHNPPLVRHSDGTFGFLKMKPNFPLALIEGFEYPQEEFSLEHGDIIFIYTDGVTEATNTSNECYGEERLKKCINSADYTDMKDLCEKIRADVYGFIGEAPQFDDITMLAVRYK